MNQKKNNHFMPLVMALCVVVGIMIGTFYANHFSGNRLNIINSGSSRLSNLLHIIDDQYVDSVNIDSLVEKAIPQILAELDPHSVYISAKDVQLATDDLKGSFSGVGIEFITFYARRGCDIECRILTVVPASGEFRDGIGFCMEHIRLRYTCFILTNVLETTWCSVVTIADYHLIFHY